jgi:hypothetical protein
METKENKSAKGSRQKPEDQKTKLNIILSFFVAILLVLAGTFPASAHCDSYDGPVIKDALKALETKNVNLVLKWVNEKQEIEIIPLFNKTYNLKNGDKEVYAIAEKHFFETLVRLHRETEGAPYSGLKPAGSTKMIVQLSDKALASDSADDLVSKLNAHIEKVIREKYAKVARLDKTKDVSAKDGRAYVKAYVDYTHTIEAIHDILEANSEGHSAHNH